MNVRVFSRTSEVTTTAVRAISELIRTRDADDRTCVLGISADSASLDVYENLVGIHRREGLSFRKVVILTLDQFYPMDETQLQSQAREIREYLLDHLDLNPENVIRLDGTVPAESVADHCNDYEERIRQAGGIDLVLLGVAHSGHLAFNGPGSSRESRTRVVSIDRVRRNDLASDFFGVENVPHRALTTGVATILDARRIILLAQGDDKASVVRSILEGPLEGTEGVVPPVTFLRDHPDVIALIDESAARDLTENRTPWVLGPIRWDRRTTLRAVKMLALSTGKAILKLTGHDYSEGGLQDLLATAGNTYDLNLRVFRHFQSTITGWPGGKPTEMREAGDRPGDRDYIFPKRVLVFSPHPDDDVISMGGTLIRLVDQGHDVHVAYQTSGNIAVFDEDALRYTDFVTEYCNHFGIRNDRVTEIDTHVDRFLRNKAAGQVDSDRIRDIKGMIRRNEARAAARCCGIPEENLHFMDLPFYETGRVRKQPVSDRDIELSETVLREIRPHQIYAAGDLSDPHGTHRTCLSILLQALERCSQEDWYKDCVVWLYRGAWQEWPIDEIEMAVPLSPQEVERKRTAIFKHESQKDRALFPGSDKREFWQRSEARNAETARLYDSLGLAEYEAIEGFVRWDGESGINI